MSGVAAGGPAVEGRGGSHRALWFSTALPCAWLLGLLVLGTIELAVDPNSGDGVGNALDTLSIYLWFVGLVVTPAIAVWFARRLLVAWSAAIALAVLCVLVYLIATLVTIEAWFALGKLINGETWWLN